MIENRRYVVVQDAKVFSPLNAYGNREGNNFPQDAQAHFDRISLSLRSAIGEREVEVFSEAEIDYKLSSKAVAELDSNPEMACICLDKFLLSNIEASDAYRDRFFRFDICRTTDGKKVPRQGGMTFEEQMRELRKKFPDLDGRQLMIVDSGVYTGGTIKHFLSILSSEGIGTQVKKILCFVGDKKNLDDPELKSLEILNPTDGIFEWVDARDFSPLGGKKLKSNKTNMLSTAVPYLFPWSDGSNAGLDKSPHLFTLSLDIIESFRKLLGDTGTVDVTFRELARMGFSLPVSLERNIPISINEDVDSYLKKCIQEIRAEQGRPVVVLDMDGTLYQLDGENGGFRDSKLDKTVMYNALSFIVQKERCSYGDAEKILNDGMADEVGLSMYLSRRYGITRNEYFDVVWDIPPDGIIMNGDYAREVIPALKLNPQLKVILLTHSPAVWARQVLQYLGINDHFESVYSGDQHGQKDEVFELLAGRYNPENIISVGDQYETDIKPAERLGMRTLLVRSPEDIKQLLRILDS